MGSCVLGLCMMLVLHLWLLPCSCSCDKAWCQLPLHALQHLSNITGALQARRSAPSIGLLDHVLFTTVVSGGAVQCIAHSSSQVQRLLPDPHLKVRLSP